MPAEPLWYVALAVVIGLGAVFVVHVVRDGRREWLRSGRTAAEYDERLTQYRRRLVPRVAVGAVLFLLGLVGFISEGLLRYYFPLVLAVVFVLPGLHDLWNGRGRIVKDRNWRAKALWHAASSWCSSA